MLVPPRTETEPAKIRKLGKHEAERVTPEITDEYSGKVNERELLDGKCGGTHLGDAEQERQVFREKAEEEQRSDEYPPTRS